MRKISFLVLVGILAFSLESCSLSSKSDKKSAGTIVTEVEVGTKQANKTQNVEKESLTPEVKEVEEVEEEKVTGLIPATQPEIRVRNIPTSENSKILRKKRTTRTRKIPETWRSPTKLTASAVADNPKWKNV